MSAFAETYYLFAETNLLQFSCTFRYCCGLWLSITQFGAEMKPIPLNREPLGPSSEGYGLVLSRDLTLEKVLGIGDNPTVIALERNQEYFHRFSDAAEKAMANLNYKTWQELADECLIPFNTLMKYKTGAHLPSLLHAYLIAYTLRLRIHDLWPLDQMLIETQLAYLRAASDEKIIMRYYDEVMGVAPVPEKPVRPSRDLPLEVDG